MEAVNKVIKTQRPVKMSIQAEQLQLLSRKKARAIIMKVGEATIMLRDNVRKLVNIGHSFKWPKIALMKRKNGTGKATVSINSIENSDLSEGEFRILMSEMNSNQVNEIEQSLQLIEGLRLLLLSGSAEEGTEIIVRTDQLITLTNALKKMRCIEQISEHGNTVNIIPKTQYIVAS